MTKSRVSLCRYCRPFRKNRWPFPTSKMNPAASSSYSSMVTTSVARTLVTGAEGDGGALHERPQGPLLLLAHRSRRGSSPCRLHGCLTRPVPCDGRGGVGDARASESPWLRHARRPGADKAGCPRCSRCVERSSTSGRYGECFSGRLTDHAEESPPRDRSGIPVSRRQADPCRSVPSSRRWVAATSTRHTRWLRCCSDSPT